MTVIGFLGLGSMGSAMASRLVEAGHEVHVWNRSAAAVDELIAHGAIRADMPGDALSTGVSISMLADDRACEAVFDDEAVATARGIHVNMASISPAAADRLSERLTRAGVGYVAAPVLGRPNVAAAGKLNILAAGDSEHIEAVQQLLDVLGARTWRLGTRPRLANVTKIAVNYNLLHTIQALGESIALVESHGVKAELFHELLVSSLFDGVAYRGYGAEIVQKTYTPPGFAMPLGAKDLGLASETAAESALTLPTLPILQRVFELALQDDELSSFDWGAAAEVTIRRQYEA